MNDYPIAKAIVDANTADVKAAISVWANGNAGKFNAEEKRSEQDKRDIQAARLIAGSYLVRNTSEIKSVPVLFACEVASTKVINAYSIENPSFYTELKAADFKINDVKLRPNSICNIAISAGDLEYIAAMPIDDVAGNANYAYAMVKYLLSIDVTTAKAKVTEIENWYIIRNREIPSGIQAVSKALTSRLVDEKLKK